VLILTAIRETQGFVGNWFMPIRKGGHPATEDGDQPARVKKSERTRGAILDAARRAFAEHGYERATVRDIAARVGVDPALVMRYFGSKEDLFAEASEFDLHLPDLAAEKPGRRGALLIAHFLDLWEGALSNGTMAVLMRAAATNDHAAAKMRRIFAGQVVPALAKVVDPSELSTRAGLVSSQLLGLALCRYVLKLPPVAMLPRDQIVRSVGPTLQNYLTGKL
jgi:AcrR family transcriptional regulator